jgi:hypothetical protein
MLNNVALAAAGMAGAGHGKEALAVTDLARTLTGGADFFSGAARCSGTFAGGAAFVPGILDFNLGTKNRVLKGYFDVITEVGALSDVTMLTAPAAMPAKESVEDAGKIAAENILETPEGLGEVLAAPHAFNPGMAELVIGLAFLVVSENLVGFGGFFKFIFRFLISRVLIGMIL